MTAASRLMPGLSISANIETEKVDQALVEEDRLAFRRQAPDLDRDHVHELRQLALPVAQRLQRAHLLVDIEGDAVPLHDRSVVIAPRLHPAFGPAVDAILFTPAKPHGGAAAGFETIAQRALYVGSILGMNQLLQQLVDARFAESVEIGDDGSGNDPGIAC